MYMDAQYYRPFACQPITWDIVLAVNKAITCIIVGYALFMFPIAHHILNQDRIQLAAFNAPVDLL
jgi:hypothetical protein